MSNCGKQEDHCCWINGKLCQFLEENIEGRRWSCSLRRTYGSWKNMTESNEYKTIVKPEHDKFYGKNSLDCGDFPLKGEKCEVCGDIGI